MNATIRDAEIINGNLCYELEDDSSGYIPVEKAIDAFFELAALRARAEKAEVDYIAAIKANNEVAYINADLIEAMGAMNTPMPCGHKSRYAVNRKEGTSWCALCELEARWISQNRSMII